MEPVCRYFPSPVVLDECRSATSPIDKVVQLLEPKTSMANPRVTSDHCRSEAAESRRWSALFTGILGHSPSLIFDVRRGPQVGSVNLVMGEYYMDGPIFLKSGVDLLGTWSEDDAPYETEFILHGDATVAGTDGVINADGVTDVQV